MVQIKVIVQKLNRRKGPITDFGDKNNIIGTVSKGYLFTSDSQITNNLGTWYADRDGYYYWQGGVTVLGPAEATSDNSLSEPPQAGKAAIPLPSITPKELPVSQTKCRLTAEWLDKNFGDKCQAAVEGISFYKRTFICDSLPGNCHLFLRLDERQTPGEVLGRCVFDASGDANGTRHSISEKHC